MRITLTSERAILAAGAPSFTIESADDDVHLSAFHLLAASLAYCTYSVLYAWAQGAGLDVEELSLEVSWTFAEEPGRVGAIDMALHWPSLPEVRRAAAGRAAATCAIHATLAHGAEVRTEVKTAR